MPSLWLKSRRSLPAVLFRVETKWSPLPRGHRARGFLTDEIRSHAFGEPSPELDKYVHLLYPAPEEHAGNLVDRIRFGWVTDFLDFQFGSYHYPSFNVADSAITIGAALVILSAFIVDRSRQT